MQVYMDEGMQVYMDEGMQAYMDEGMQAYMDEGMQGMQACAGMQAIASRVYNEEGERVYYFPMVPATPAV